MSNKDYMEKMKQHIAYALELCYKENVSDPPVKWEYLKYEIRKYTVTTLKEMPKICDLKHPS